MKLSQLQDFFPPERRADIEALYRRFTRKSHASSGRHGETPVDVESFVIHLHERELITTETLRDILTQHEISLTAPPDPDTPIARLTERHRQVALLGKGAMGEVFIGRDPDLQRTVAIKKIDPKLVHKSAIANRFFAEAQITAQLDHPSIVPIYGVERDPGGRLSYAMKFVRGQTLSDYIAESHEIYRSGEKPDEDHSLKARIETLLPVMNAIDYAHKRGVIHRDLKPDNIMVGEYGEVLVMDWGIARPIGKRERVTDAAKVEKTRTGSLVGTPAYMSPEQASGATEELDGTSDQYSLGLILFELVTLKRAITGDSSFETVVMAASGQRAPLAHISSKEKIPRELRAVIEKATAKDPDDRYETVGDFADDLRRFLRDESVLAQPDNFLQRIARWIGRNRGLALGLGFALVMAVFVVAAVIQWRGAVALEEQRAAARLREQQLIELGGMVSGQAHAMDNKLYHYQALLSGFVNAAQLTLSTLPTGTAFLLPEDLEDLERAPKDFTDSEIYQTRASVDVIDFQLTPPLTREAAATELQQLARLAPTMRRVGLLSAADDTPERPAAEIRNLVLEEGVPLVWVYLGTESGIVSGWPGVWEYDSGEEGVPYDPRKQDWYTVVGDEVLPVWNSSGVDESGLGLLITASQAIRHPVSQKKLGVAAVDLTFPYFIDTMLEAPRLAKVGEAFIVDRDGKVLVRASQKDRALDATEWTNPDFEDAKDGVGAAGKAILAAAKQQSAGHLELDDERLAVWSKVEATGWLYVVIGETKAMLEASRKAGGGAP